MRLETALCLYLTPNTSYSRYNIFYHETQPQNNPIDSELVKNMSLIEELHIFLAALLAFKKLNLLF